MSKEMLECDGYKLHKEDLSDKSGKKIFDLLKSGEVPYKKFALAALYFIDQTEDTELFEDWNEDWLVHLIYRDEEQ